MKTMQEDIQFNGYLCTELVSPLNKHEIPVNTRTDEVNNTGDSNPNSYQHIPSVLMTPTELALWQLEKTVPEYNGYTTLLLWLDGQVSAAVIASQMDIICRAEPRLRQIPIAQVGNTTRKQGCTCQEGELNGWHASNLAHWVDVHHRHLSTSMNVNAAATTVLAWCPSDNIEERWLLLPAPSHEYQTMAAREQAAIQHSYGEFYSRHHTHDRPLWRVQLIHGLEKHTVMALAVHQCVMDAEALLRVITTNMSLSSDSNCNDSLDENNTADNNANERSFLLSKKEKDTQSIKSYGNFVDTPTIAFDKQQSIPWYLLVSQSILNGIRTIYTWILVLYSLLLFSLYKIRLAMVDGWTRPRNRSLLKFTGWTSSFSLSHLKSICARHVNTVDIDDLLLACIINAYNTIRHEYKELSMLQQTNEIDVQNDDDKWILQLPMTLNVDDNTGITHRMQPAHLLVSSTTSHSIIEQLEAIRRYRDTARNQALVAAHFPSANRWIAYAERCEMQISLLSETIPDTNEGSASDSLYMRGETLPYYQVESMLVHPPMLGSGQVNVAITKYRDRITFTITSDATRESKSISQRLLKQLDYQLNQMIINIRDIATL
ncbi:hypothetical protein BDF22DRAFT_686639 [Syncephalis plumigaleata]|nr:hypothetical protein BDF22DRAFT_686639 [Syncephalis plumigaleata]